MLSRIGHVLVIQDRDGRECDHRQENGQREDEQVRERSLRRLHGSRASRAAGAPDTPRGAAGARRDALPPRVARRGRRGGCSTARTAHCLEGAVFAAAALRVLGFPPLLLDLEAVQDTDHVLAVYQVRGHWGAIAKSNFAGLRYREPVYRTVRELVMSYFESYINLRGDRTLRAYSAPVNLARFDRCRPGWMTTDGRSLVDRRAPGRRPPHAPAGPGAGAPAAPRGPALTGRRPGRLPRGRAMTSVSPERVRLGRATSRSWRWTRSSTRPTRRCSAGAGWTARSTPRPVPSCWPSAGRSAAASRAGEDHARLSAARRGG